ncbi:hypothetical protein V8C35DRAFT_319016 [Trichoderma chlorosporum]
MAATLAARRRSFLNNLSGTHSLFATSFDSLLVFNLKEVQGRRDMTDPHVVYLDSYSPRDNPVDLLPLPEAITRENITKGASWTQSSGRSQIHQELLSRSISRDSCNIFDYNLSKLKSGTYDGMLRYREALRCVGASEHLACPYQHVITLHNAVVRRTHRVDRSGFHQVTMELPQLYESCRAVRQLINSLFASGR